MPIQSARDLLVHELQDIRDAEQQASEALQQMAKQAGDEELKQMIERRMKEGERILQEVEKSVQKLEGKSKGTSNSAARALIQAAQELVGEAQTPEMKRAVMIAGAQKVEHYCIAAWGTVKALARELGAQDLAHAMERAVAEGYRWDEEMSDLAESRVNPEALEAEVDSNGGGR